MILVINANTNDCKIYHYDKHPAQLKLLKEISHPANKLKNRDLTSDRPGHYQGGESARGSYSPHMEEKENEINNFSREIARELNQRRNENDYKTLIVIAPPHMYGLLVQHLNKHVKNMVTHDIQKDLIHYTERELLDFLKVNTKYHE